MSAETVRSHPRRLRSIQTGRGDNELWTTTPERSRGFWHGVYEHLPAEIGTSRDPDGLVDRLYAEFTDLANYPLFDDVLPVLERLTEAGPDARRRLELRGVARAAARARRRPRSVRRPGDLGRRGGREARSADLPPRAGPRRRRAHSLGLRGDDPVIDIEPALAVGMFPVLIDRRDRFPIRPRACASRRGAARGDGEHVRPHLHRRRGERDARRPPERLVRIRDARQVVLQTAELVRDRVAADGGGVTRRPRILGRTAGAEGGDRTPREENILLRDPETGLVDFLGEVEGRRVWLCWRSVRIGWRTATRSTPGSSGVTPETVVTETTGTRLTRVVVMGATAERPPPRIHVVVRGRRPVVSAILRRRSPTCSLVPTSCSPGGRADECSDRPGRKPTLAEVDPDGLRGRGRSAVPRLVESHVVLTNARGMFDRAIAEYVLGLMLLFAKDLPGCSSSRHAGEWEHGHRDARGQAAARRRRRSDRPRDRRPVRRVRDDGPRRRPDGAGRRCGVPDRLRAPTSSLTGCRWADYIVNILPGTEGTKHLFDDKVLRDESVRTVRERRAGEHRRPRRARRRAALERLGGRRSTCSRTSRSPPTVRCGICRTPWSRRTSPGTSPGGARRSSSCSSRTSSGT